jgi:hypothetical protein
MGIQCAFYHSTVDDSSPGLCAGAIVPNPGTGCIGHRLDGWANRDLNVGAIVALAPDLSAFANLLGTSQDGVRTVLRSWGPGTFDAELILDGKAFNPQRITDGVVTATNVPGATLIPPAFGLGHHRAAPLFTRNLHRPAVDLENGLHDRETQTQTARRGRSRGIDSIESVGNASEMRRRDSHTRVCDLHPQRSIDFPG